MKVQALNCDKCGAPLDVPRTARFVTCSFCDTRLSIHRTESAAYTEVMGEVVERLANIERQNEVERLDREWMMSRDRYTVKTKHGESVPSVAGSVIAMAAAGVFAIFFLGMTSTVGAPGPIRLIGVLALVGILIAGITSMSKAKAYERDQRVYRRKRRELMKQKS